MLTTVRDRVAAATGAAYVVIVGVGNAMATAGTDQSAHPSGAQVLRDANRQAHSTAANVGLVLEILGFVLFMVFLGYLAHALYRGAHRSASGPAAATALVAGIMTLAVKLASAAPLLVLFLDRDQLSPQLARVLNDMNGIAFLVSWLPFALFVAATAAALHQARLVGRPTSYVGIVIGIAGLILALVGFIDPINANPSAFLIGLLWVTAVSVRLAVKPATESMTSAGGEYDAAAPRRVPVGA
jgi:predicted metal-binding membrane protein